MTAPARTRSALNVPHSWELDTWPPDVWPHTRPRADWISRAYRQELIDAGALSRVGKLLVFNGTGYSRWLESRARHVTEFTSNNPTLKRTRVRTSPADAA